MYAVVDFVLALSFVRYLFPTLRSREEREVALTPLKPGTLGFFHFMSREMYPDENERRAFVKYALLGSTDHGNRKWRVNHMPYRFGKCKSCHHQVVLPGHEDRCGSTVMGVSGDGAQVLGWFN